MASYGTRVFVLGGLLKSGVTGDEAKHIHVFNTGTYFPIVILFGWPPRLKFAERLNHSRRDTNEVNRKKITQLVWESPAGPLTQGQAQGSQLRHIAAAEGDSKGSTGHNAKPCSG